MAPPPPGTQERIAAALERIAEALERERPTPKQAEDRQFEASRRTVLGWNAQDVR
jgi:hypothetical protein